MSYLGIKTSVGIHFDISISPLSPSLLTTRSVLHFARVLLNRRNVVKVAPRWQQPDLEQLHQALDTQGNLGEPLTNVDGSSPRLGSVLERARPKSNAEKWHDGWVELLNRYDWQWFVTFTFKEEIHPEAADKLYRVWINKLNRSIYGQRWRKRAPYGCKWARALEWQKRGVLHYHALISNVGYASRELWAAEWAKLGEDSKAGFIKIDQYDDTLGGAEAYLSKYVAKDGDIDLSENTKEQNYFPDHDQRKQSVIGEVASR